MQIWGRGNELGDVVERLRTRRLVTLTGPGGIGKTALAQSAAAVVGPEFTRGAVQVDLTRIDDPEAVYEAIAGQLGCADFDSLINSPGEQPALIVIDNCEHVLDAAADAVVRMLDACRMPTVLATSRSPLDVPGESILALGPLEIPPDGSAAADSPAMRLFLDAVRNQGVAVDEDDPDALAGLAEICRRLDGVPLALELGAARLRTTTAAELLRELDERPHALARRRFRGQASHRSIAEVVTWSFDLLDQEEREFFVRLGVFAGPFTGPMACAVAGSGADDEAALGLLDGLVAASLVVADTSGDATWYRLLHPIRAVALDRLGSSGQLAATRSRFVDQVVWNAVDVIGRMSTGWGADGLNDLMALYDNIAASLRWTTEHDEAPERSLTLLAVLWGVIHQAHTAEIRSLGEAVIARWDDPTLPMWPDAAATVATCRYLLGEGDAAIDLATATLPAADASPFAPATLRRVLAQTHRSLGRPQRACELFAEAANVAAAGNIHGFAMELRVDHAIVRAELGDIDGALEIIDAVRSEALTRSAPVNRVWAAAGRGAVLARRDPAGAIVAVEEALDDARSIGYPAGRSFCLRVLASARLDLDDIAGAARTVLDLVDELLQRGGLNDLRMALDLGATVLERTGDERWADLAITAATLPITSVAAPVESDLFERAAGRGRVLSIRDAYQVTRHAVGAVLERSPSRSESREARLVDAQVVSEGDVWRLTYADETIRLSRSKGLEDIARLLAEPGREISSLDLVNVSAPVDGAEAELLDSTARRQYEDRVRELAAEIEEAEADHDIGRAERRRVELDAIVDELTSAVGLGGRARTTTSASERARSAVTQRIRSTIKRIAGHHPALGAHLRSSVSTGTFCSYAPDPVQTWFVDVPGVRRGSGPDTR